VVLTFAVLYAVSVLAGVLTRSPGFSAMIALGVWGASSAIVNLHNTIRAALFGTEAPDWVVKLFDFCYTVLPKTTDLKLLGRYALSHSYLSPDMYARTFGRDLPNVDWAFSLGTTAAFTAAMLILAAWRFRRADF
jgi:hypothetical protein